MSLPCKPIEAALRWKAMEKRIVDYIIKADTEPAKLAKEVTDMLHQGYLPYGSPCENGGGTVWQAMVKYEDEPSAPSPKTSVPTPMYKGIEVK